MVANGKPESLSHLVLPLLNTGIDELFDPAAVQTHDVVMVSSLVEFEDRHPILEVMTGNESGGLELRKNAIHGSEPDILIRIQEGAIDVFGREVACCGTALENLENL
jgi:hypothetical protein